MIDFHLYSLYFCFLFIGTGGFLTVFRLLRLLRVLKLIKSLPQLSVIVDALIMGIGSIGFQNWKNLDKY